MCVYVFRTNLVCIPRVRSRKERLQDGSLEQTLHSPWAAAGTWRTETPDGRWPDTEECALCNATLYPIACAYINMHLCTRARTLTRSWELLKRPMRRMELRMGSVLSSSMLCVQTGGRHWRCVAKMALFIMVKSSLSNIFDTSGSCPLTARENFAFESTLNKH